MRYICEMICANNETSENNIFCIPTCILLFKKHDEKQVWKKKFFRNDVRR